jgi:uncharacterized protein YjdB
VESITLNETAISLRPDATKQLTAAVEPPNAENKTLSWTSATPGVATVSDSGLVTAVAVGATQITAAAKDGSNKTAVCTVTVTATEGGGGNNQEVQVTSIAISPATGGLAIGGILQLTPTVLPANATNKTVTWSSNTPAVATVSSSGLVTGVTAGTATITATANDGSGASGTCSVTVTESGSPPISITINASATGPFYPGNKIPVSAVIDPIDPENSVYLSWTSSNTAIATVERTGTLTAVITAESPGTATITAANQNSGGGSATYEVTVSPVPVSSVTLNHASRKLSLSGNFELTASVGPENAADKTITWSVTPQGIVTLSAATGSSITVTASAAGTAAVTAAGGGISAACTVTVTAGSGLMIDFAGFDDEPSDLPDAYIGDLSKRAYDSFTVTINNGSSYSSIRWYVNSAERGSGNSSYIIHASDFSVGTHDLTVVVQTNDGTYFSKKLSFGVVE